MEVPENKREGWEQGKRGRCTSTPVSALHCSIHLHPTNIRSLDQMVKLKEKEEEINRYGANTELTF